MSKDPNPNTHTHQKKSPWTPTPVAAPTPEQLGSLTASLESIISGGAKALSASTHLAAKESAKHGEPFESQWFLMTPYLTKAKQSGDGRSRLRAHHALRWRPRYLAAVAVTGSRMKAMKHAPVDDMTAARHIKDDPDFALQVEAAKGYFVELLHDRVKQRALEGDCEPVFYMGVPCGWVRKFDSRLQIEVLRAHLPQTYKTPGDKPITINNNMQVLVFDAATRAVIQAKREAALRRMHGELVEVEALPPAGVASP